MTSMIRHWSHPHLQLLGLVAGFALVLAGCAKDTGAEEANDIGTAMAAPDTATAVALGAVEGTVAPLGRVADTLDPTGAAKPTNVEGKGQTTTGDASYKLQLDVPDTASEGAESVVRVTVVPSDGWKMNREFPTRLKVTAPAGVDVAKGQQSVEDAHSFGDKRAVFTIEFTPRSAGDKAFEADFKFAVCTDATCDPKRERLAWVVPVQ